MTSEVAQHEVDLKLLENEECEFQKECDMEIAEIEEELKELNEDETSSIFSEYKLNYFFLAEFSIQVFL